jgi:hypothetical protein
MNDRRLIFRLGIAVAVLALLHLALFFKNDDKALLARRSALVTDVSDEWTAITIDHGGTNLIKMVKGKNWRLEKPYQASVDESAVMRMYDALTVVPLDDSMTDAELTRLGRSRSDFSLDPPTLTVTLDDGKKKTVVGFGKPIPSGKSVYASVSGVNAVFVVPTNVLATVDRPAGDFRRRTLFAAGPDEVTSFSIKNDTGAVMNFIRDGEVWTADDRQVSAKNVKKLLESVMGAAAVDFIWPVGAVDESASASSALLAGYGLDVESAVTVSMKCLDGVDRWIAFGKPAKEGLVYAFVQNGGAVVTVDSALKDLVVAEKSAGTRVFPQEASAVSSFTISDGAASYSVARCEAGAWRLDSPVSAPANSAAAETILARILALTATDAAGGDIRVEVTPGRESAKVSRSRVLGDFRFEDLRSREVVKIDPLLVSRLVFSRSGEPVPVSVVYDRDRQAWKVERSPVDGIVDTEAVNKLVAALNPLMAASVVKLNVSDSELREYGLERPYAALAVDQRRDDSVRRNILFGNKVEGGRYATLGASDAVFIISDEVFSALSADLIAK